MPYTLEVGKVVAAHVDEIRGDLELAQHQLRKSRTEGVELERQISHLEALLALVEDGEPQSMDGRGLTLHDAMVAVLEDQPGHMLRANDLASEINRRRLYRMRDGRPVESQQVHARVGHYPTLFTREGTFIKLVE